MITISKNELLRFISRCDGVSDSKILPIYSYVKLVCEKKRSYMVKHNGHRFVVFDIEATFKKDQTVMIETKPLFGFVKFSRGADIKITVDEKNVKLDDGERKISCQTTQDLYPTVEDNSQSEKINIPGEVVDSFVIAKTHTMQSSDRMMRPWECFIHIKKLEGKWYVIATRREVTYFQGFTEALPELSFEPEIVSTIKEAYNNSKSLSYSSTAHYDHFQTIDTRYGFIKPETKCSDAVEKVLQNFKSDKSFEVDRSMVVDFCEMINSVNETTMPAQVLISGSEKDSLLFNFSDLSENIRAEEKIPVTKKTFEFDSCNFLSRTLLTVLNGVKAEKVKISYAHRNFIVTTDNPYYIGAVMEINKL